MSQQTQDLAIDGQGGATNQHTGIRMEITRNRKAQRTGRNAHLIIVPRLIRLSLMHKLIQIGRQGRHYLVTPQDVNAQIILQRKGTTFGPSLIGHIQHPCLTDLAILLPKPTGHLIRTSRIMLLITRKSHHHLLRQAIRQHRIQQTAVGQTVVKRAP